MSNVVRRLIDREIPTIYEMNRSPRACRFGPHHIVRVNPDLPMRTTKFHHHFISSSPFIAAPGFPVQDAEVALFAKQGCATVSFADCSLTIFRGLQQETFQTIAL
jgi:hypothetical protein